MAASLLIVDDETKMCNVLARMLAREGYAVDWSDNPAEAISLVRARAYDLILCDLRMPGFSGIDVLQEARQRNPAADFVMMTAYATPETAVESMKMGAIDYLIKPFAVEDLKALIARILADREGVRPVAPPAGAVGPGAAPSVHAGSSGEIVASSPQMREVLERIRKVAASEASVLLRGESGTGKEVMARALHQQSARAGGPMVCVNCGAIPESLMESELFGHVKGAFTGAIENRKGLFESADGGTVFLDEIGELPLYLQVKLLRVLQEGEIQRVGESQQRRVNVRVIAATNRDLEADVAEGSFRKDLYYRLNVIPVVLPPLRERRSDIEPLITHFLGRHSPAGRRPPVISAEAMRLLMDYDYPGNIRELENAVEHAVVLCDGEQIRPEDLPLQVREGHLDDEMLDGLGQFSPPAGGAAAPGHLEQAEISLIIQALEKTGYNFTRAAQHLGITRRTLGYRINKHGLYDEVMRQKAQLSGGSGAWREDV